MKVPHSISGFALIMMLTLISNNSWAQTSKELDITLSIVDEQDSPETIINRIPLPPPSTVISTEESITASSNSNSVVAPVDDAVETIHNQIENTTNEILNTTGDVLTNTLNDTISTGDLESLPKDIIDQLPEDLPGDLLPPVDDVVDDLTGTPTDVLPDAQDALDSAIDNLENTEIPDNIEQTLPIPEPTLPDGGAIPNELPDALPNDLPESLPVPVDDLTYPLNP